MYFEKKNKIQLVFEFVESECRRKKQECCFIINKN